MVMTNPRKITIGLILLCLAIGRAENCPAAETAPPIAPSGRIELFNGKDFTGWTFCMRSNADPAAAWTVTNGVIHCSGKGIGYLRTEGSFREYRLTVEWRFVKMAPKADNTGVLVHIQPPDQVWPKCIQIQGKHDRQGDLIFMNGAESNEHKGKDANTAVPMTGAANEKPVGEWNACEVECRGDGVSTSINGTLLNTGTGCTPVSGAIGFQSEGAEFEIRKVSLEPLKPSP